MRTHSEQQKSNTPQSSLKEKKNWAQGVHAGSPHWLPRILMHISVLYQFWPRLVAGP
jgi:hypothetical protein